MSEELKLCPFCGGKFGIVDVDGYMIIHTYDQDCPLYSAGGENGFIWRDEDALVSEFNRRPIEDALLTRITDLEAENARLLEEATWVSVEDRLPEDGQFVLAIENGGKYYALFSGGWFWDTITHMPVDPTVWREFPSLSYPKM